MVFHVEKKWSYPTYTACTTMIKQRKNQAPAGMQVPVLPVLMSPQSRRSQGRLDHIQQSPTILCQIARNAGTEPVSPGGADAGPEGHTGRVLKVREIMTVAPGAEALQTAGASSAHGLLPASSLQVCSIVVFSRPGSLLGTPKSRKLERKLGWGKMPLSFLSPSNRIGNRVLCKMKLVVRKAEGRLESRYGIL